MSASVSNCSSASSARSPGVSTWHGATALTRTPRRGPLDAELAGQGDHAGLAHVVGEVAAADGADAADRGDVDDRARARGQHPAPALPGEQEVPGERDGE